MSTDRHRRYRENLKKPENAEKLEEYRKRQQIYNSRHTQKQLSDEEKAAAYRLKMREAKRKSRQKMKEASNNIEMTPGTSYFPSPSAKSKALRGVMNKLPKDLNQSRELIVALVKKYKVPLTALMAVKNDVKEGPFDNKMSHDDLKTMNLENSINPEIFSCSTCGESFEFKSQLIIHEVSHKVSVTCQVCSMQIYEENLKDHLLTHIEEQKLPLIEDYKEQEQNLQSIVKTEPELMLENGQTREENELSLGKIPVKEEPIEHVESLSLTPYEPNVKRPQKLCKSKAVLKALVINLQGIDENGQEITIYECKSCGKRSSNSEAIGRHVKNKHHEELRELIQTCKICRKIFSKEKSLIHHMRQKHPNEDISSVKSDPILSCVFCNKIFVRKEYLRKHISLFHPDGKILKFYCDVCGRNFKLKESLRAHMGSHLPNVNCHICNAVMKYTSLYIHLRDVHQTDTRKFECQTCGANFKSKPSLVRHEKIHDKKLECKICNKKFPYQSKLNEHLFRHANPASFTCDICGKKFGQKHNLKKHLKIHDKNREKPFKCKDCQYSTDREEDFKRHLKVHLRVKTDIKMEIE